MHTLKAGDHVLCCDDVYGGTYRLFTKVLSQKGLSFDFVDFSNIETVKQAMQEKTAMLWVESPTNPLLKIIDIQAIAQLGKAHQAKVVVDNTFATPFVQKPLALGADVVVHSTTKYIGGHSDVVGGACITNDSELAEALAFMLNSLGTNPGPFDAWLTHRGLKTLAVRMKQHANNAHEVASFLENHDRVAKVVYPGLASHPQYDLAQIQMNTGGGMVVCYLDASLDQTKRFLSNTRLFALAESLGGVESLIEHPAIMTHASVAASHREKIGITDGLVRLSVGIEDAQDLMDDLAQALDAM
jgi:cystathionine gamma-lyase